MWKNMSSKEKKVNSKTVLIETFEIAEINFLQSFKGINPEIVTQQFKEDINHVAWIIGHCASHMDSYLSIFIKSRKMTEKQGKYHAYGASKEEIKEFPFSFKELIDIYLLLFDEFLKNLQNLEEEDFEKLKHPEANESLRNMMQRITLHYMGHTGQIVLLRRIFGDSSWSFVGGISKESRKKMREEWINWWNENKEAFS
jgi:hypothetical protein